MSTASCALHLVSTFSGPVRAAAPLSLLSSVVPITRQARGRADPLSPGSAGFAHRGVHDSGRAENCLDAFAAAIEMGAGIECDLGLSADDHVLVFHDRDAVRMCGSSLEIASSRWADLSRLRVGKDQIPTLEMVLDLVDGQVPLLLDVKVRNNLGRWAAALANALSQYDGAVGVVSFDPFLPRLLRAKMSSAYCGLLVRGNCPAWKRQVKMLLANPDFVAVEHIGLGEDWVASVRRRMPVYAWTIRSDEERELAHAHVDAVIWEGDGRPEA